MAVPGPVTSDQSAGCHHIIRDWQGTLVTTAAEVIEHLSPVGATLEPTTRPPSLTRAERQPADQPGRPPPPQDGRPARGGVRPALDLDAMDLETTQVLDALPARGGMAATRIAQRAGLDPTTVVRCLAALAASGFVERCDEGWRLSRA